MANHKNYYENLLKRYLADQCDQEELNELMDFLNKEASNRLLLLQLKEQYANPLNENAPISPEQSDRIRKALKQKIKAICHVDMEKVMAWKNEMFYLGNADLKTVIKQLGRWYNIKQPTRINFLKVFLLEKCP